MLLHAGRQDRGIACAVAVLALLLPLAMLLGRHGPADLLVLGLTVLVTVAVVAGFPLLADGAGP